MSFHKPFQHCCNCSSCTIHNHFRCRVPSARLSGSLEKTFLRLVQPKRLQVRDDFHSDMQCQLYDKFFEEMTKVKIFFFY